MERMEQTQVRSAEGDSVGRTLVKRPEDVLNIVKIASPCPASWEKMRGDSRVRFCDTCQLNVYNLSGMSRRDAAQLVLQAEGRLCVRFYQRADGTVLTQDCPFGLRAVRRRAALFVSWIFLAFLWIGSTVLRQPRPSQAWSSRETSPIRTILDKIDPPVEHRFMGRPAPTPMTGAVAITVPTQGKIAVPPPPERPKP